MKRDAVIVLGMRVSGTALWLVYTIVLARTLSKSDFATTLYILNFSMTAVLVVTLGRDVALLRWASRAWESGTRHVVRQLLSRSRKAVALSGATLTLGLLVLAFAGFNSPVTTNPVTALLSAAIISAAAQMGLNRDCLRAVGRVWQSQLGFNVTRALIPIAGSVVLLALGGMSTEVALLLFLLSLLLSLALEEMFLRQVDWTDAQAGADAGPSLAELRRSALSLWPGDVANAIQMRAAGLVAGAMLPPEAAALFLAAERIAGLAQFPIAAASQAAAPKISRATILGTADTQVALSQGSRVMIAGTFVGAISTAILAAPALMSLGPGYVAALPITLVLVAGHLSWLFFGLAQSALNWTGCHRTYSFTAIMAAVLSVISIYVATRLWSGVGSAAAFSLSWWLTNIAYTVALRWRTGLRTGVSSLTAATPVLWQRQPR